MLCRSRLAAIDWPTVIAAIYNGDLPCSGGERRVLRLAASLADGIPVDPRDALTGMDTVNVDSTVQAMLHAAGRATGVDSPGRRGGDHRQHLFNLP